MPEAKAKVENEVEELYWVFKQNVKEVNGQVGNVVMLPSVAKKLIEEGKAQDPRVEDGYTLKYIEGEEPKPRRGRKPNKAPKTVAAPKTSGHKPAAVAKNIKPGGKVQKVITQEDETTKSFLS